MRNITKYFGFLVPIIEWSGFFLCIYIHPINWNEPVSQFGYYQSTRLVFGVGFTLAAILCYLYARNLDAYWQSTSKFTLLAGIFITIVSWVPYRPNTQSFVFDVHNTALVISIALYSLPMLFIGYKKTHARIAQVSRVLFFVTTGLMGLAIVARISNAGIIYIQLIAIAPVHIWLIMTNWLLLEDLKTSPNTKEL